MPIVNRANYTPCPSCQRWMHVADVKLDGNRVRICQECYERADKSSTSIEETFQAVRHTNAEPGCQCVVCRKFVGQVARASTIKQNPPTQEELIKAYDFMVEKVDIQTSNLIRARLLIEKFMELRGLL